MATFRLTSALGLRFTSIVRRGLCLVPLGVASLAFAASEPSLITGKKQSFGYSWEEEIKLGAEADKDITQEMGLYDNPALQTYVQSVGQRVLQMSNFNQPNTPEIYRNTQFNFRVLDSAVVNAFALPGGYVYVTRGLLAHVQNEAQLAVVLGHEVAHVAARHSSQQAQRSKWGQLGVLAGAILGQKVLGDRVPDLAPTLLKVGGQGVEMFMLRHSREAEFESDNLGVGYAARAGYNAADSARFFQSLQRLAATEGKSLPTWQSTHPDPGDRARRVVQIASSTPPAAGGAATLGEEEFLRQIEGIVLGDDPREGFAQNGVFYHPVMRFQFPVANGWKLVNQKSAVVQAEPNGRGMMGLRLAAGTRARDASIQFAQQAKVQVTASGDTFVNGLPTTVIIGTAATDEGEVGVWNAFIELDGKVMSLLGYAPAQAFEAMRPTFESVAAGFGPLRDNFAANVQPARLKLVRADRNSPFASFVPVSLPPQLTADAVAILNQANLADPVSRGRVLKVPDVQQPAPPTERNDARPDYRANENRSGYPNTYPNQGGGNSPNSSYPAQRPDYGPQAGYPQNGYPTQQPDYRRPSRYPDSRVPQQPSPSQPTSQSGYPAQSYPSTNYPQQQPADSRYPQTGYPRSGYPQSGTGGQGYPAPTYPPQNSYPYPPAQNAPQFPQPNSGVNSTGQPQNSAPVWPR